MWREKKYRSMGSYRYGPWTKSDDPIRQDLMAAIIGRPSDGWKVEGAHICDDGPVFSVRGIGHNTSDRIFEVKIPLTQMDITTQTILATNIIKSHEK